ncbi:hypothetical protein RRG08_044872 [Elysia crispata]|uniref:Uncharacterized protein n=1 Tax=Elysia crispata TaxID=231223 RepID=A0AAE0XEA3_9GAST|nr:hypothetical protein RRG08_044872 [Elysia crispata]
MGLSGQLDRISRAVPRRLVGKEHNKIIGVDYTGGNVSLYRPVTAMISSFCPNVELLNTASSLFIPKSPTSIAVNIRSASTTACSLYGKETLVVVEEGTTGWRTLNFQVLAIYSTESKEAF